MKCRDLRANMPALELFATRKIEPGTRMRFAQQLLRLREAHRLMEEELQSLTRRHARSGEDGSILYGQEDDAGNRNIILDDPDAYGQDVRQFLAGECEVHVTPLDASLVEKIKEATPVEIAALLTLGLLRGDEGPQSES